MVCCDVVSCAVDQWSVIWRSAFSNLQETRTRNMR